MGLERNNGWERRGHDLVKGTQMPRPRDISSDPAVKPHKPHQGVVAPYRCNHPDCPVTTYDRDISSVTGSAAQALLDEYDFGVLPENAHADLKARIAAIQREAVDAFVRDELPGLLEATRTMHDPVTPTWATRRAEAIAKEVEQRAQTS